MMRTLTKTKRPRQMTLWLYSVVDAYISESHEVATRTTPHAKSVSFLSLLRNPRREEGRKVLFPTHKPNLKPRGPASADTCCEPVPQDNVCLYYEATQSGQ